MDFKKQFLDIEKTRHLLERVQMIENSFLGIKDWEEKYSLIISWGKSIPLMAESFKTTDNLIKGCQSQVWLFVEPRLDEQGQINGHLSFHCDSDASIVKGLIAILYLAYNNTTPDEILQNPPHFLDKIGIKNHLSMNRSNGLNSMIKQTQIYALAYKAKGITPKDSL